MTVLLRTLAVLLTVLLTVFGAGAFLVSLGGPPRFLGS